jgi:hypothetical protein
MRARSCGASVGKALIGVVLVVALGYSAVAVPPSCQDDDWEPDNDLCTRVWIDVGETHTHTLCDPDFKRFRALAGATYVIETTNLLAGTDPMLELYLPAEWATYCRWDYELAASDDNSGGGANARLEWTATETLGWPEPDDWPELPAVVGVLSASGAYVGQYGYDLMLGCTANCPPPVGPRTVIPVVAHAEGKRDTVWTSDVWVFNPGDEPVAAELVFNQSDSGTRSRRALELPAGVVAELRDVVGTWPGLGSGRGSLEILSGQQELIVVSRTATAATSGGTFGQLIEGQRWHAGLGPEYDFEPEGAIPLLAESVDYRSNLGLAETIGRAVTVHVLLSGDDGKVLGATDIDLGPYQSTQLDDIFALLGVEPVPNAVLRLIRADRRDPAVGWVLAYASNVDNRSGDPWAVPLANGELSEAFVPGVAAASGAFGSLWRTDLRVLPTVSSGSLRLTFLPADRDNIGAQQQSFPVTELPLALDDAVTGLGGSGTGTIRIRGRFQVAARTYSQDAEGTHGQFIPGFATEEAVGVGTGVLTALAVQRSEAIRTNVGFANVTEHAGLVEVRLVAGDGTVLGVRRYEVLPLSSHQVNDVFTAFEVPWQGNCRIEIQVLAGEARVIGYASVVDNRTNDPSFVPARPFRGPEDFAIVMDNVSHAVSVDRMPEAVTVTVPQEWWVTVSVVGEGHLGRPDLPLRVVCVGVDTWHDSVGVAVVLEPGQVVERFTYYDTVSCFIPDWIRRDDNIGGVTVTLADAQSGETESFELDASANCVVMDQIPGPLMSSSTAYHYRVEMSSAGIPGPWVLVMMRDPAGGLAVQAVDRWGEVGPSLPGDRLLMTILDWGEHDDIRGTTRLIPQ